MRVLLSLIVLLAGLSVPVRAFVVATYNVENYLVADRMVEGVFRAEYPKPEPAKRAVREVIRAIGADLVALQEMGRQPFLDELQRDLRAEGVDYPHALVLDASDADRHVAVLSRRPFKEVRRHTALPVKFLGGTDVVKRGVLEVTVETPAGDVTIFIVHLKSRRTERKDDPEGVAQRTAEAEAVRDLVLARFPDPTAAKFIVCGDWNDTRLSRPVRAMAKRGDTVIGEILRAYDSRGETWTHAYRREDSYSRIDYLMVSPALKPFVTRKGTAQIHDGPGQREGSDHRPVFVTFDFGAK